MFAKATENLGLPQWQPKDHPDFLTDMNKAFRDIDSAYSETENSLDIIKENIKEITETNTEQSELLTQHTEAISELEQSLNELEESLNELNTNQNNQNTVLGQHTESISELEQSLNELSTEVSSINESIANLSKSSKVERSFNNASAQLSNLNLSPGMHTVKINVYVENTSPEKLLVSSYINVCRGDTNQNVNILGTPYYNQHFGLSAIKVNFATIQEGIFATVRNYIGITTEFDPGEILIVQLELIQ